MALKFRQTLRNGIMIVAIGLLAACSQKAETLKLSVAQFGVETEHAFDKYDAAYSTQFDTFPKSALTNRTEFATNIMAFNGKVDPDTIDTLLDPDAVKISPDIDQQWKATLNDLRGQYRKFIAIFDNIEAGSILGASAVKKSGPILEKLRKQLATIGESFARTPPRQLTRRSTLLAELNQIRSGNSGNSEIERLRIEAWWQKWQTLIAAESHMQTEALKAFVTASSLGKKLQSQINNYARLNMASLIAAVEDGMKLRDRIGTLGPKELLSEGTNLIEIATK